MDKKLLEKVKSRHHIYRGDDFYINYQKYLDDEIGKKISQGINEKTAQVSNTNASYRTINHWCSVGLLDDTRTNNKGWRRFSILDNFWLCIISELRKLGLPIEIIKKVKQDLFKPVLPGERCSKLEFYIAQTLNSKIDAAILIFFDGSSDLATSNELAASSKISGIANHISITIGSILEYLLPGHEIKSFYNLSLKLGKREVALLADIRRGNFETIKIRLKDNRIERIEGVENIEAGEQAFDRVSLLIKDGNYQDIELKQENGKIVSVKRTLKKR